MTKLIEACPECESSNIYRRKPSLAVLKRASDTAYRCEDCQHNFEEPLERESRGLGTSLYGDAKALADADPGAWP